jgi:hypothetical protein
MFFRNVGLSPNYTASQHSSWVYSFTVTPASYVLLCSRALSLCCNFKLFALSAYCACANGIQGLACTFQTGNDLLRSTVSGIQSDKLARRLYQADKRTDFPPEVTAAARSATVINARINELSDLTSAQSSGAQYSSGKSSKICLTTLTRARTLRPEC